MKDVRIDLIGQSAHLDDSESYSDHRLRFGSAVGLFAQTCYRGLVPQGPPNGVEHLKLCTQGAPQLLAEAKEAHPTRARGGHEDVTRRKSVSAAERGYAG